MLRWVPGQFASGSVGDVPFVYVVGRVNQGIRRELQARLAAWGLSIAELTALSALARRPGLSNAQLARRAMVTPQSMIEILSALEARGLVRRELDPDHARILRAELTPAGAKLLADAEVAIRVLDDEVLADVAPENRQVVLEAMMHAMERLRSGLGGSPNGNRRDSAGSTAQASRREEPHTE
jgi:DNA-binding MarR family transcriptional regulator